MKKINVSSSPSISALFDLLSKLYRDKTFPGAYKGLSTFYKLVKSHPSIKKQLAADSDTPRLTKKIIDQWAQQDSYVSKNKRIVRKFQRRRYKILNPNAIWEADLLDMSNYANKNKGVKFILMVVDQFTKKLYTAPCKTKSKGDVKAGFEKIFQYDTIARPNILYSDNGKEFKNDIVRNYLSGVLHIKLAYTTDKDIKAAIVERTNRTFKQLLVGHIEHNKGQYINDLPTLTTTYNNTPPSTTRIAPNNIDPLNVQMARSNMEKSFQSRNGKKLQRAPDKTTLPKQLKPPPPRFSIGQWVRIAKEKHTFKRGYSPNFSDTIFQIYNIDSSNIVNTYSLQDLNGDPVTGNFYYNELSPITFPSQFHIQTKIPVKQFTNQETGTTYKGIQIKEYYQTIWIPKSVIDKRNNREKAEHTISSSVLMHWLRS